MFHMKELACCKYPNCNKYFKIPIRLPCDNTICKEHLDEIFSQGRRFLCKLCYEEHDISQDEFKFNIEKLEIMSLNLHLNDKQKVIKDLIDKLQTVVDDMTQTVQDPYNYLYRHVSKLRDDVDFQRDELKNQIDTLADHILNKLDTYEKICKSKITIDSNGLIERLKKETRDLNESLFNLRENMRIPNVNDEKLDNLKREIEKSLEINREKIENFKVKLLDNKLVSFVKNDFVFNESLFGRLNISNLLSLVKTFDNDQSYSVEVINDYLIAAGSGDDKINIWDAYNGRRVRTLTGHSGFITSLKTLTNDRLASCSFDKTIKIWNMRNFKCIQTLKGHSQAVSCSAFISSLNYLITGSYDTSIKIWSLDDFKCVKTLKGHTYVVFNLIINPKNNNLISCSADKTIKIWSINKKFDCVTLKGHQNIVTCLALNINNELISGSYDGTVKFWNIDTGECLKTISLDDSRVQSLLIMPKNFLIIGTQTSEENFKVLNLNDDGKKIKSFKAHSGTVNDLKVMSNGNVVTCSEDRYLKIWSF